MSIQTELQATIEDMVKKGKGILAAAELYQRMEDKVQWLKSLESGGSSGGVVYVMYADD